MHGASAEKIAEDYGQPNLFNEAELERQPLAVEPKIEEITYTRKKSKKKSLDEKYGDLPIEEIVSDISDKEKACDKCGSEMTFMKYEVRRELKIVPAKVTVVEHKRAVTFVKAVIKTAPPATLKLQQEHCTNQKKSCFAKYDGIHNEPKIQLCDAAFQTRARVEKNGC